MTNVLDKYTSGFIFAQISANKGIKQYRTKADLKMPVEFEQLFKYKTCYSRKQQS